MTKNKNIVSEFNIKLNNEEEVQVTRTTNDINGNPRYIVHFLSLGLKNYEDRKEIGLSMYRGSWYGGGIVINSYDIKSDIEYYINKVEQLYNN